MNIKTPLRVYLSGEIHSDWRAQILQGISERELPIEALTPVTNHEASDACGERILGAEEKAFWKDHKAAKINLIRIHSSIERADIVIVRFGEKYKQWNAAFDAGYAVAKGKKLIVMHSEEHIHALKEIDGAAHAVVETPQEAVEILRYVTLQE